eukprot:253824_1
MYRAASRRGIHSSRSRIDRRLSTLGGSVSNFAHSISYQLSLSPGGVLRGNTLHDLFAKALEDDKNMYCDQCPFYSKDAQKLPSFKKWIQVIHWTFDKPEFSKLASVISVLIITLITVSTTAFVLETEKSLTNLPIWAWIEGIITITFSIEYLIRLATCKSQRRFVLDFLNLIDLFSILPFYIELAFGSEGGEDALRVVRVGRLARMVRLFKSPRLRVFMNVLSETLRRSSDSFWMCLCLLSLVVVVFSSLIYYAERGVLDLERDVFIRLQDGLESPYSSIAASSNWTMVTISTLGYGDIVPVTPAGKFVSVVAMITGLLVLAFPVVIIGTNFDGVYLEFKDAKLKRDLERKIEVEQRAAPKVRKSSDFVKMEEKDRNEIYVAVQHMQRIVFLRSSRGADIVKASDSVYRLVNRLIRKSSEVDDTDGSKKKTAEAAEAIVRDSVSAGVRDSSSTNAEPSWQVETRTPTTKFISSDKGFSMVPISPTADRVPGQSRRKKRPEVDSLRGSISVGLDSRYNSPVQSPGRISPSQSPGRISPAQTPGYITPAQGSVRETETEQKTLSGDESKS